ncbi:MAG: hypothetical protein PW792_12905 [Acidobacteriaceae bacterium]|nr:hypothetical protein [Acidobacteriaceae bacterium]
MIDETQGAGWAQEPNSATTPPTPTAAETVGYCQDCGRPLSRETVRTVGSGVFCEPCLEVRLGSTGRAGAATGSVPPVGYVPPMGAVPPPPPTDPFASIPPVPGEPSPTLAGLLGFIPGVGAMYNGQYAKGIAHILIFTVLMSIANNVSDIFGLLVAGWIFYQVFDAIHTARARRDGTPLPNMFGLNDIGDRVGIHWNAMQQQQGWNTQQGSPQPGAAPQSTAQQGAAQTAWNTPAAAPQPTQANWAGYVPPTAFGTAYAPAPTPNYAAEMHAEMAETRADVAETMADARAAVAEGHSYAHSAATGAANYAQTYTGAGTSVPNPYPNAVPPVPTGTRFPSSAIWLIALGIIFLVPGIHLNDRWLTPIVLFIAAGLTFYRKLSDVSDLRAATGQDNPWYTVRCMRGPIILLLLAILFALQAMNVASFEKTWPLLLIVVGIAIAVDRSFLSKSATQQMPPYWQQPPVAPPAPAAAAPQPSNPTKEEF